MLARLVAVPGATHVLAKCPATLEANGWYHRRGFALAGIETTRSGKTLNLWKLSIAPTVTPDSLK